MKNIATTFVIAASVSMANAVFVLVPNGDFEAGGTSFSSFASAGTAISYEAAGGNSGGFGKVDNTAGAWGGGLVAPSDNEYPGNTGIPLADLGLTAGMTYSFSLDMINLDGTTGVGGVKFESWGAAIISNSGDLPATGQSADWATYTWDYTIDAAATSIKIVPLLTPGSFGAGQSQSSIGFDNVGVENNLPVPEPSSSLLAALSALGFLGFRRRK